MTERIYVVILFAACLVALAGCLEESACEAPFIVSPAGDCCLDENANGRCDDEELERLTLVVKSPKPNCTDDIQNQGELGVDCGGPCLPCPTCFDELQNQGEESVDCGGPCPPCPTCDDGVRNQGELGVDCGGPCPECGTCTDGEKNQGEVGVDCGGPCPPCDQFNCTDGVRNQGELGVDCGGPCDPCFCDRRTLSFTDTKQEGYIIDSTDPPDGIPDRVLTGGYNVVGDNVYANTPAQATDDRISAVLAFPLEGLKANVTDATVYVTVYQSTGRPADTLVDHIECRGALRDADYASEPLHEHIGVIIAANASNGRHSLPVTSYVNDDLAAGRHYSCYRLYWTNDSLTERNNSQTDRRVFYGVGGDFPPRMTYVQRPCVDCYTNADCERFAPEDRGFICRGEQIQEHSFSFRCENPGTVAAECVTSESVRTLKTCSGSLTCIDGENECFPEHCYNGEMDNYTEEDVDCGGKCRPCHCFNGVRDQGELGVDCGLSCTPCPPTPRDDIPPTVLIRAPRRYSTYHERNQQLMVTPLETTQWCRYRLNDGAMQEFPNVTMVRASPGENTIFVACADTSGNVGNASVTFTVEPWESMLCPTEDVGASYTRYFAEAESYRISGSLDVGVCNLTVFESVLPEKDEESSLHVAEAFSDGFIDPAGLPSLSFDCRGGVFEEMGYLRLRTGIDGEGLRPNATVIVYFNASNVAVANTVWRIQPYVSADAVDPNAYVDVPYAPRSSACAAGDVALAYQELPLSAFVPFFAERGAVDLRLALYTSNIGASLTPVELGLAP